MSQAQFTNRLHVVMENAGITTAEKLAWRVGVTKGTAYTWLKGHGMPDANSLIALRREFGVSIDWLLGVSDTSEAA